MSSLKIYTFYGNCEEYNDIMVGLTIKKNSTKFAINGIQMRGYSFYTIVEVEVRFTWIQDCPTNIGLPAGGDNILLEKLLRVKYFSKLNIFLSVK